MMIKRTSLWARLAAAHLLLPLAFTVLPGMAAAEDEEPLGDKCNPNQGFAPFDGESIIHGDLSGTPIEPGDTLPTPGTDAIASPELIGKTKLNETKDFSFSDNGGLAVSGTYQEVIKASNSDGGCKQHLKLKMFSGCVSRVRFTGYFTDLDIVGDYRKDQAGKVASKTISRSLDGLEFEFLLKRPVCAGETTRYLLLNTLVRNMHSAPTLVLVAKDGKESEPFVAHVPATVQ